MTKLRYGHAPHHVRGAFLNAVEAFTEWRSGEPEPSVEFESHDEPGRISISEACGLVWNCTDVTPGQVYRQLQQDLELSINRQTYAACAQAVRAAIESRRATHTA